MEKLREKLVVLKNLLETQNNSISNFIEKLIIELDEKDYSCINEILSATKIQDFMSYKAAYLFDEIWDLANSWKINEHLCSKE
jgi:hypothetical protein